MNISPDTILFDRYQIREQLSQKAGRSTFLVDDLQLQKLVIVKIPRFDSDFQWDDFKLFEREALTLKNLAHPAIPKYLDYFDLEAADIRGFALVQTYIKAPALENLIGDNLSQAELYWLGQEVSDFLNLELQIIYPTPRTPPEVSDDL